MCFVFKWRVVKKVEFSNLTGSNLKLPHYEKLRVDKEVKFQNPPVMLSWSDSDKLSDVSEMKFPIPSINVVRYEHWDESRVVNDVKFSNTSNNVVMLEH